jgi:hypothetical protein
MKLTQKELIKIIREVKARSEEDGESFELDVRHYRLKDEYGKATVGYPKRYEDNLRKRGSLYKVFGVNETSMGVYLMNDVNARKIKTKKELELAIDELASYYKKIRIRRDPKQTFLQRMGEEPLDTRPTHRPVSKEKIRAAYEKAQKDNKSFKDFARKHSVTPGLDSMDTGPMRSSVGGFLRKEGIELTESYVKQVIREEYQAVLDEKKKKKSAKDKMKCNSPRRIRKGEAGHGKKKFVVKACDGGTEKIIRYGDAGLKIKRKQPGRRKNFRARHNCDNPGSKLKARYWSCKNW